MAGLPLGAGIDIIEIERIERAVKRFGERFLRKVYTDQEITYCRGKVRPSQHYAARFAAKEAVYKAAGGVEPLRFKQIEITRGESGCPAIRLIGAARLSGEQFIVSISHTHTYASAVAIRVSP